MKHFFVYATKENDLNLLKEKVENAFKCSFTDHESEWFGEYALWNGEDNKSIKIYPNYVEGEGYHIDEFPEFAYLLEISYIDEPVFVKRTMVTEAVDFELIRHDEI